MCRWIRPASPSRTFQSSTRQRHSMACFQTPDLHKTLYMPVYYKNCRRRQPLSHLTPPPRITVSKYLQHLIIPETRVTGLHFWSLIVWAYLHSHLCSRLQKTHFFCTIVRFGRSRSSKVDDFGTNWKGICDFLLVRHCDYGPILHRFWDMATYWLKLPIFATPLSFGALAPYVPFGISRWS